MFCKDCLDAFTLRSGYVACQSKSHARFMDMFGGRHYRNVLKHEGSMILVSCETLGLVCPDCRRANN